MPYSQSWLEDQSAIRIILAEVTVYDVVAASDITIYLSNAGYITTDGSVSFNPIITGSVTLQESINEDSNTAMSFGDLELLNANGEYDNWLDSTKYVWANRPVKIYFGDPNWMTSSIAQIRTDFLEVFDGVIADIDSRTRYTLNIKVRDKLERLNAAISENKIGTYGTWSGGQQNADQIKPLVFGEVHNISPILIDPSTLEYMYHDGACEGLIEIRDNGVPVWTRGTLTTGATVTDSTGKFKLTYPAVGAITASVQGVKDSVNLSTGSLVSGTYNNNIASLVALITTQYGKASTKFTASDLDLVNLAAFSSANTQKVGTVISDRENVLSVCQQLASSVGAQLFNTRQGLLQLITYGVGVTAHTDPVTITTVDNTDIIFDSLAISNRPSVVAAIKLGYCKNYTVQSDLVTAIPQEDRDAFATEWYTVTKTNNTVKTLYKLEADPTQDDTSLVVKSEADTEAQRRVDFYSQQHTVYSFTAHSRCMNLKLGQAITLIHTRFDLYNSGSGKSGQVVGLRPNWSQGTIEVEVLI